MTIFFRAFAIGLLSVGKQRHYTLAPIIALGGVPFVAALLAYDRAITGSAFLLPEIWGNPSAQLGFLLIDRGMTFLNENLFSAIEYSGVLPMDLADISVWQPCCLNFEN